MATLTAADRRRLPRKDFAGPKGSYPIPDENHARLALAMVSKYGSAELKSKVRARVKAKYPGIDSGGK